MKYLTLLLTLACFFKTTAQVLNNSLTDVDNPYNKSYEWPDNQPENCHFPESKEIIKIVFTGKYANYTHSDTWFPMWAADGNEYSPFTDGTVDGYMSVGHFTNMHKVILEFLHKNSARTLYKTFKKTRLKQSIVR